MTIHRERTFEDEVVAHLVAHGWLEGSSSSYDQGAALYPEDLFAWLRETQPAEWEKVSRMHGATAEATLLDTLRKALERDGTLRVLRHGLKHINARFELCQFKPAQTLNPTSLARYAAVRCRVVRQLRYSSSTEQSLDLVLFVNGLPVATLELKTDFTQSVHDAIRQYRDDRLPRDSQTKRDEPLLQFKRGAFVHFAVSTSEVWMSTHLQGRATSFLPFNRGHNGGTGNPPNPAGYATAYLWETVLQRDQWLAIIGSFIHLEQRQRHDADGRTSMHEALIFPRYHQLDAVTALVDDLRLHGSGQRYLIQHSAGSGKSNTIAWLAHHLAGLFDAENHKMFDSVLIITDRTVLDSQLQATISQFEHKAGVIKGITNDGAKSGALATALRERVPIIIVTLQTFPFALDALQSANLRTRRFA